MKKTIMCPNCGTRVSYNGKAGERIILSCPNCGTIGSYIFPKKERKRIVLTKKGLVTAAALAVTAFLFLTYVFIPVMQGSTHFLIVLSGSMRPAIHPGDIVVSSYVKPKDVKVGDVITFTDEGNTKNYVTHRVVEVLSEHGVIYYKTKGDANENPDMRLVKSTRLVGHVAFTIPYLGYLPVFAKTFTGFFTLVILPGILIILNEIWNILRPSKRRERLFRGAS
ncbi:MAG: signal peptidase I [Thermoplasmata archaeon]|nr:signal peptidase I [Thermoplasmata archaeon]